MTELLTIRDFLRFALSEFGRYPIELGQAHNRFWPFITDGSAPQTKAPTSILNQLEAQHLSTT